MPTTGLDIPDSMRDIPWLVVAGVAVLAIVAAWIVREIVGALVTVVLLGALALALWSQFG